MRIKVKGAPRNHRRMSAMTRASFRSTKLHAASRDVTMPIVTDRHGHLRPSTPDATPPLAYTNTQRVCQATALSASSYRLCEGAKQL